MEDKRNIFFVHFEEEVSDFDNAREVFVNSQLFNKENESNDINFFRLSEISDKSFDHESFTDEKNRAIYLDNLKYVIVELADGEAIENIENQPGVTEVNKDQLQAISTLKPVYGTASDNWGYHQLGIHNAPETGKGVKVAILDSGIDRDHPFFVNRDIPGFNVDCRREKGDITDRVGHGTHMAGIIAGGKYQNKQIGIAPDAEIFVSKVLNDSGDTLRKSDMAKGIDWAVQEGCRIINMSWGVEITSSHKPDTEFQKAAKLADSLGIFLLAAAGNNSERSSDDYDPINSPANLEEILAITALDAQGKVYSRANRAFTGQKMDFAAPGVDIFSSYPTKVDTTSRGYALSSGTSQATAYVSGLIALLLERHPQKPKSYIIDLLKGFTTAAPDIDTGYGLPQIYTHKNSLIMSNTKDYQGTIILEDGMGLQEVYSSQNYGTFYSLYMSFDKTVDANDSDIIHLSNILFQIVNYKGVVNLGIVDIDLDEDLPRKTKIFKVNIRAFEKNRGMTLMDNHGRPKTISIDRKKIDTIKISRLLLKMTDFDPLKGPNHPDNIAFDDEFYYRDGVDFTTDNERLPRGGMEGAGGNSSWKRCYEVDLKIVP